MSITTLYTNEYITVEYRSVENIIYHTVHQPIGDEQLSILKDALLAGSDALSKYGVCKWLSDDRKNGPLPTDLYEWGATFWEPHAIEAGWKYWANVVPLESDAAGTLMPVIQNLAELGLHMVVFTDVRNALAWLDKMTC